MSCGRPVRDTADLRHTSRVEETFRVEESVKENFRVKGRTLEWRTESRLKETSRVRLILLEIPGRL